jgi:hypothetical protein
VRRRPDLAAELYQPQPFDFRGEQAPGTRGWYPMPVFTRWADRLFCRLIGAYILASQRHADAPRITDLAREGLRWMHDEAESGRYSVTMDFRPGDMQFINNYHVLHGRTSYVAALCPSRSLALGREESRQSPRCREPRVGEKTGRGGDELSLLFVIDNRARSSA